MTRIECELTEEGYSLANKAFLEKWSGDHDELLSFIKTTKKEDDTELAELAVLSLGAGDGARDIDALKTLQLEHPKAKILYTPLEPNQAMMDKLKEALKKEPTFEIKETLLMGAEDYDIPKDTFDVILMTHSLYHVIGKQTEVVKKAVEGLKKSNPNSRVVVALSSEKGGIFQLMSAFWGTLDFSRFETEGGGLFGQESLLKLLEENYPDSQYSFKPLPSVYIDVSEYLSKKRKKTEDEQVAPHLLNFCLQSDTSKLDEKLNLEVIAKLETLTKCSDGVYQLSHPSGLAVLYSPK
eukprot:Nitzschia sp. Nitz4//scaffold102_size76354//4862//5746//NITZ4_005622-RA/size76354-processed-gene-0.31-mRNA-1//-1//CDS//3329532219//5068//frame0